MLFLLIVAASGAVASLESKVSWMWLPSVASVLAVLGATFTDTPAATAAKRMARQAAESARKADEVRRGATLAVALLLGSALVRATTSCTPAQTAAAAGAIGPGVDFVVCVLSTADADSKAHDSPAQTMADVLSKCGGDATSIATVLDADANANATGSNAAAFHSLASYARTTTVDAGH